MNNFKILLVEDEQSQADAISGFLSKKGYDVSAHYSFESSMEFIRNNSVDMVISDFQMPGKTGEDVLNEVIALDPGIPVVIMTAYGSIESAVELMKKGAFDYLQKPIELDELIHIIEKARERQDLISENALLREQLQEKHSFESIISQSGEMESVLNIAARVANSKASVLIRGESGTGKELVARAIHFASDRKDKPFVVVNCAAMPETLFESELFGHEKGSFTGAIKDRIGKFEQAHCGTLFIDEVGDIPLSIQVKMLRAIQFGEIEKLGAKSSKKLDVRIISATNRKLEDLIEKAEFREDLYYRLNVVGIQIPPLKERKLDIAPLVDFFIDKYAEQNGKDVHAISKEAMETLMRYNFPGNVRELENMMQRAVVLTRNDIIRLEDLPNISRKSEIFENTDFNDIELTDLNSKIESLETAMIKKALDTTGGNQVKAAEILGISERTIRYKLSKYRIKQEK